MKFKVGDIVRVIDSATKRHKSGMLSINQLFLVIKASKYKAHFHPLDVHFRNPGNDDPYYVIVYDNMFDIFELYTTIFRQEDL